MKKVLALMTLTGLFLVGGCESTQTKITELESAPDNAYCKVEITDGGVVFIPNKLAADSAKVLGELPSCQVLYDTFYRYSPVNEKVEYLDAEVEQLKVRVSRLENPKS